MGNSNSVCSLAHAAGGVGGGWVGVGEVGWGEKRRSVRGGGEARGGEGACFFFFRIIW